MKEKMDEELKNTLEVLREEFEEEIEALKTSLVRVERKETMSSYEYGDKGNRHKIYYWTVEELEAKLMDIDALMAVRSKV